MSEVPTREELLFSRYRAGEISEEEFKAPPATAGETFTAGLRSGISGMRSNLDYASAIFNSYTGDERQAEYNVRDAEQAEKQAAEAVAGLPTFEETVNDPTASGVAEQVIKYIGQGSPDVLASVVTAGVGATAAFGLRGAVQFAANRLIKDSVYNLSKGVSDAEGAALVRSAFELAQGTARRSAATKGAVAGAVAQEYPQIAGAQLGEELEVSPGLTDEKVDRAALVAIPSTAVGVGGEVLLGASFLKNLAAVAAKRSTSTSSIYADLVKSIASSTARGSLVEGSTEAVQEGISVTNRMLIDDDYTAAQAKLRIAEGAFGGAVVGGALGGGSRSVTEIFKLSKRLVENGYEKITERKANEEEFGDTSGANTTPEPQENVDAQVDAMFDSTSSKEAVWVAGNKPYAGATEGVKEVEVQGYRKAYAVFIPGRGTFISRDADIAQAVAAEGATDGGLASVLGYSAPKPADGDRVVQVTDNAGRIVSEELTNEAGLEAAIEAGKKLSPRGGKVQVVSVDDTLRGRKKKLEAEQALEPEPEVQEPEVQVDIPENVSTFLQLNSKFSYSTLQRYLGTGFDETKKIVADLERAGVISTTSLGVFEVVQKPPVIKEMSRPEADEVADPNEQPLQTEKTEAQAAIEMGLGDVDPELMERRVYKPRKSPDTIYAGTETQDGTEALRERFLAEFDDQYDIDWRSDYWGSMSDAMLKRAIEAQQEGLAVEFNRTSEGMQLETYNYEESYTVKDDKGERRVPLSQFLQIEIGRAQGSQLARDSNVTLETADKKIKRTNLIDLLNAGRRINQSRDQSSFDGDAAAALSTIIGELMLAGYKIRINTKNGPLDLREVADALVKQSTLDRKHYRENPQDVENGIWPDRIPEVQGVARVVVGRDKSNRPLTLGKVLRPRNVESAPVTPLQNDDQAVRTPVEDSMGRLIFEDEVGFDGQSDIERFESNEPDVQPVANPGVDGPAKYKVRDNKSYNKKSRNVQAAYPFGTSASESLNALISKALKFLRLRNPIYMMPLSKITDLDFETFAARFENQDGARIAFDKVQEMKAKTDPAVAFYLQDINGFHMIVFDDQQVQNELQLGLTVAHELGHAMFNEELDNLQNNPALFNRLLIAFNRELAFNPELASTYQGYSPDKVFEEWYADNIARAVKGEFKKRDRGMVDGHFNAFVTRLKKLFSEMQRWIKLRLGLPVNVVFQDFLNDVLAARRSADFIYPKKSQNWTRARSMAQNVELKLMQAPGAEVKITQWRKSLKSFFNQHRGLMSVVFTVDGQLRGISSKLADMFYIQAQKTGTGGNIGFLRSYYTQFRTFQNSFEKQIGDISDPKVQRALREAASDTQTSLLSGKAQRVRKFLEDVHKNYIAPSQSGYTEPADRIEFQENYFPVMLDLMATANNSAAFVNLVMQYNPDADRKTIENALARIVKYNQAVINGVEIETDGVDPAAGRTNARQLTSGVPIQVLQEAGFLKDPDVALTTYLRQIAKRIEFNKATKDLEGNSRLLPMLNALPANDRAFAEKAIAVYLGHQSQEISPWLRQVNSWGQFIQFITILPFSTIASFPELAGPILNFKGLSGFQSAFQEMRSQFVQTDREAAVRFARDIGITSSESMATAWVSEADLDYMDPVARDWSDKFFKAIGLDFFTRFTREFAAGMAQRFLREHAFHPTADSARYLADLGVTADEVKSYFNNQLDITSPQAINVKRAAQKFVESSVLRPNAAERPMWASDPRFSLIWQLKGYFYAFYKVIIKGAMNEARSRADSGAGLTAVGGVFALAAVAFVPLAMASMEAREWAKFGLSEILPFTPEGKDYFRSDNMDWGQYAFEVFDRTGFLGPWTMGSMMHQNAEWDRSPLIPLLGPSVETLDTILRDGWRSIPNRLAPVVSAL
jgi:hypothetical protein